MAKRTLADAKTEGEAVDHIMVGLKFFLLRHTKKTAVVLLLMIGGLVYAGIDYAKIEKTKVFEAKPIGEQFTLIPTAIADDGTAIVINGKTYGYADTSFVIWKLRDRAEILIWNKRMNAILGAELQVLEDKERMKQYKK